MNPSYAPLEPSSLQALGVAVPSFGGSLAPEGFLSVSTFLYTLFFVAIIVAAFYRYVVAGALRMQASESTIRQSNEIIKRVTLGLLGVFSLFILLFTVNKNMVTGDVDLRALTYKGGTSSPQVIPAASGSTPSGGGAYADRVRSHNQAASRFSSSGIKTNRENAPCSEVQFREKTPSCTSLAYLPEESIQMILSINAGCRCTVIITGGTEPGHSSHGENRRPFDLRIKASKDTSDPLYTFISNLSTKGPETGQCYATYRWKSFTFCDEKPPKNAASTWAPHFHVY